MSVTVNDIYTKLKGYARNQNLDSTRAISVIDSASTFVLNHLGLPGYEAEYSFDYFDDQHTYTLPAYVGDLISLRYDDETLNKYGDFKWRPSELLFKRFDTVSSDTRLYSNHVASGTKQLVVLAKNSIASFPIDTFDFNNATNWTASLDATTITDDTVLKEEGAGSLRFNVDTTLSGSNRATLTKAISAMDLSPYVDIGVFKMYVYLPTVTEFTSVSLSWETDSSNYYKQTVTEQQDGTAFAVGWNELAFDWYGSTQVGTPDPTEIITFVIDFDYTVSFVSVTGFHVDYLRLVTPDTMILQYYKLYKGESSTSTALYSFTAVTDKFYFEDYDPTILELIAIHAAILLNPQLLVDDKYVRDLYKEYTALFMKRYPRKRSNNLMADPSITKTNHDPVN